MIPRGQSARAWWVDYSNMPICWFWKQICSRKLKKFRDVHDSRVVEGFLGGCWAYEAGRHSSPMLFPIFYHIVVGDCNSTQVWGSSNNGTVSGSSSYYFLKQLPFPCIQFPLPVSQFLVLHRCLPRYHDYRLITWIYQSTATGSSRQVKKAKWRNAIIWNPRYFYYNFS